MRSSWTIIRITEGVWEAAGANGMLFKPLFRDQTTGRLTALVRMGGGVHYPAHRHLDTEELYLLEGDLTVREQRLWAGDYCAAIAGTMHGSTSSQDGCTFILTASEPERLLVASDAARSQAGLVFVQASEGAWRDGSTDGVSIKLIFSDPARQAYTSLVHMRPGARLPRHRHLTTGQVYMLEGDAHVAGHVLGPGDYYQMPAGSIHEVSYTRSGCIFLVIASSVEILPPVGTQGGPAGN